jgi:hypothetical protein
MSKSMKTAMHLDISDFVLQVVDWIAAMKVQLSVKKIKVHIPKQ